MPPATLLVSSNLLLISNIAGGTFPLLIVLVLTNACVCRRTGTQKTQPIAFIWLSYRCSTRFLMPNKVYGVVRTMPNCFISRYRRYNWSFWYHGTEVFLSLKPYVKSYRAPYYYFVCPISGFNTLFYLVLSHKVEILRTTP